MNIFSRAVAGIIATIILLSGVSVSAQAITFPNRGGTGTSTPPALGQVLVGYANGTYGPKATSTLGILPSLSGGITNALTYWTSPTAIGATTSPTVGFITATSSNATSSFAGGITGPSNFVVQSTTGKLKLGVASFTAGADISMSHLNIGGPTTAAGAQEGNFYVSNNTTAGGFVERSFNLGIYNDTSFETGIAATSSNGTTTQRFITFYTNKAEQARIDSSGNLGVGTTSPYAKLTVSSTLGGNTPLFAIASSTSGLATSTAFIVDSFGKVGIGTSTPSEIFEVWSGGLKKFGVNATNHNAIIGNSNGGSLDFANTSNSIVVSSNMFQFNTNQSLGYNFAGGKVGIGTTTPGAYLHSLGTTEQIRAGYDGQNYASFTTNNTGDLTIDPTGSDVFIVTGDASGSLFVGRTPSNENVRFLVDDNNTTVTATQDETDTSDHNVIFNLVSGSSGTHNYIWQRAGSNKMVFDSDNGRLGIGSSTPTWKLSVSGDTFITGNATSTNLTATGTLEAVVSIFSSSLQIPRGTAPVVDAIGEWAFDTSDNQLVIATSTDAAWPGVVRTNDRLFGAKFASTSMAYASTSVVFIPEKDGFTVTSISCKVEGGTSVVINLSDANGTNDTNAITCTTANTNYAITSNYTWTAGEELRMEWGTKTGVIDYVNVSIFGTWTRE